MGFPEMDLQGARDRDPYLEDVRSRREVAMRTHVRVIAVIHLLLASGLVIAAAVVTLAVGGAGVLSGDLRAMGVTGGVSLLVNLVLLGLAAPGLFAGFGLLAFRPWARPLAVVLGALHLPGFPLGTAFAVYSLWALLDRDTAESFHRAA